MANRSWLFVPGDSERKLAKAASTGADAIIVDLEDAVAAEARPAARILTAEWLAAHRPQVAQRRLERWVRINPLDTPYWREDIVAVMRGAPDGIVLPKASGPEQLRQLAAEIYELEQRNGVSSGSTPNRPAGQRDRRRRADHPRLRRAHTAPPGRTDVGCRRPFRRLGGEPQVW